MEEKQIYIDLECRKLQYGAPALFVIQFIEHLGVVI